MNLNAMSVQPDRGGAWLRFQGNINYATAPQLQCEIGGLSERGVVPDVFDLRSVTLLTSIGIELLLECGMNRPKARPLVLIVNDDVENVLRITGISHRFAIARTESEAESLAS